MALLGFQVVVTMIVASFMQKLGVYFSFARWLLSHHLVRCLHPSNEELRNLAKLPTTQKNKRRSNQANGASALESFTIPRNTEITLDQAPVSTNDVVQLHFYPDFQFIVDFACAALIVFGFTEIYLTQFSMSLEFNISSVWCLLVIGFVIKALFSLTLLYFRTDSGGEGMICVTFGITSLLIAMGVLIKQDDTVFDFGLEHGYENFSNNAQKFLETHNIDSAGPASLASYKLVLAFICGFIGAFLTFPGLRLAKMHTDSLRYAAGNVILKLLLYANFLFPLLLVLLWIKPLSRDVLVQQFGPVGHKFVNDWFDICRILAVVLFCVLRFCLLLTHLQAYLHMAHDRMANVRKFSGRISNLEIQRLVTRVFYYLCVVALQYVAPLILLLFLTLLLRTTLYEFPAPASPSASSNHASTTRKVPVSDGKLLFGFLENFLPNRSEISTAASEFTTTIWELQAVFSAAWHKGILNFLVWWVSAAWFVTSAFGLLYHSYFTD